MKLGLLPKEPDPRTLQFRDLRLPGWAPPPTYSWDAENPDAVPLPMFANDQYGDCVLAARAHQTLRFERSEAGVAPPITDAEVVGQYLRETGGADNGLVMLYSLRDWRRNGWTAGAQSYRIHSFLEVQPQRHEEVREAMIVGLGVQFGIRMPISADDQRRVGQPWDVVAGPRAIPGSWGGHAMLACAYNDAGLWFVTWATRQFATWRWLDTYCDEAYLVIDDVDRETVAPALNTDRLGAALSHL